MATTGIAADFARMPGSRKVLVIAVIGMVLGLLYYQFVFKSLNEKVAEAQTTYDKSAKTRDRLEKTELPECKEKRLTYPKLEARLQQYVKALPTGAELPAFFGTLERKVQASGVEINKWNKKTEEPIETFVKVPVEIEITGTFMQLKRFFASLVQKPVRDNNDEQERIVSVESLVLAQPTVKNHEVVLTAKFTAVTYRQEDKPAAAPGAPAAPGAAPAAKPAAPAAAPATPSAPLPSPATPAGAKARVDNSMQKDQQRTDNAGSAGSARLKSGL